MADAFNPYHEWLGIRDAKRPPSHYRLLGLDPEENDPHIIANAGDGVIARVRSYRPGNHVVQWQELLDDLMAAKLCLLDPARKQRYDIELRAALANESTSSSPPLEPIGVTPIGSLSAPEEPTSEPPRDSQPPAAESPGLGFMWPPGLEPPGATRAEPVSPAAPTASAEPNRAAPTTGVKFPSDYAAAPVASVVAPSVVAPGVVAPPSMPPNSFVPGTGGPYNPMAPNPMAPVTSNMPPAMGYGAGPTAMAPNPMAPAPMAPNPMTPIAASVGPMNWPPGSYPGMGNAPYMPQQGMPQQPMPQPIMAQPAMSQPMMAQPVMSQPMMAQPVMVQSFPQPVMSQPIVAQPVVSQPIPQAVTSQPVIAQQVQSQPVVPQARMISPVEIHSELDPGPSTNASSNATYRKAIRKQSSSVPAAAVGVAILLIVVAVGLALTNPNKGPTNKDHVAAHSPTSKSKPQPNSKTKTDPEPTPKAKLQTYTSSAPREQPDRPENVDLVSLDPKDPNAPAPEAMPEEDPQPKSGGDEKPTPEDKPAEDPVPKPEPEVPATPEPTPPEPEAKPSKDQETAWRKAMAAALHALGEHNLSAAQTQLDAAAKAAVTTKQKDRVEGLRTVSEGVQNYWNAVNESLKGLQTGDEILIGTTRAAVVESSEDTLIIHVAGKNRKYDVKNLSMGIANFLAERWFDANAPSTSVSLGAIQFVDPNGDRAEAKRLWEQAGGKGQQVDHLLPLLNENFSAPASDADPDEKS